MRNKKAVSMTMELVVIAVIILIFVIVASVIGGKIPELFKSASESPFDEVCCCKTTAKLSQIDCNKTIRQLCPQAANIDETQCKLE